MKPTPSIFETIANYGTDSAVRRSANTLEQIQATQELEAAKKKGDEKAYVEALARLNSLKKQANFHHRVDGVFYFISAIVVFITAAIVIGVGIIIFNLIF